MTEYHDKEELRIGVVGYSAQKFDRPTAERMIKEAYDSIDLRYKDRPKAVVSGLTDLGIPGLAYREAKRRGWRTVGIATSKATDYECFPVDEKIIVGKDWGEESPKFLDSIDILVRVGGGKQSLMETEETKRRGKTAVEYELSAEK